MKSSAAPKKIRSDALGIAMACLLIQSANLAISQAYNLKRFLIDELSGGGSFEVKGDVIDIARKMLDGIDPYIKTSSTIIGYIRFVRR